MDNVFFRLSLSMLGAAVIASCATVDGPSRREGLSYQANKSVDGARDRGLTAPEDPDERISVDKSMDKFRSVPLRVVDDETGKVLIICKWVTPRGTRFRKKICATKEEFDAMREANNEDTRDWQRSLTQQN